MRRPSAELPRPLADAVRSPGAAMRRVSLMAATPVGAEPLARRVAERVRITLRDATALARGRDQAAQLPVAA